MPSPQFFVLLLLSGAAACRPQKPAVSLVREPEAPPQEKIQFDLNKAFRPAPIEDVVVANPGAVESTCRLVVAQVDPRQDTRTSGAAGLESDETRVVRRALMEARRDVVAGEVSARISAEVVGTANKEGALERYKTLSQAERLMLLAEKTGASAMLVLEESGSGVLDKIAELDEAGIKSIRDRRGPDDNGQGCEAAKIEFRVQIPVVRVRAKLVSLKANDASILADADVVLPVSLGIPIETVNKWEFRPVKERWCHDYVYNDTRGQWECLFKEITTGWKRAPIWCHAYANLINVESDRIAGIRWIDRYAEAARLMVAKMFPASSSTCRDRQASPPTATSTRAPSPPARSESAFPAIPSLPAAVPTNVIPSVAPKKKPRTEVFVP